MASTRLPWLTLIRYAGQQRAQFDHFPVQCGMVVGGLPLQHDDLVRQFAAQQLDFARVSPIIDTEGWGMEPLN